MIVVDTNVIAHLLMGGDRTGQARAAFRRDPVWVAPLLWRSEFRNVLALYLRRRELELGAALQLMDAAESLLQGAEYHVESAQVLRLAAASRCSAYDCEFVALARELEVPLLTSDRMVLTQFPETAVSLDAFGPD